MLTIDEVMSHRQATGKTFFKIDTQGFELQVLRGMEACLSSNVDWVLKMEFAPDWLSSQGTEPLDVLDYLQHRYQFAEFQERIPFGTPNLDALFANPVQAERHRRSEEHTSELQSLMRISYAVFCLKKKKTHIQ